MRRVDTTSVDGSRIPASRWTTISTYLAGRKLLMPTEKDSSSAVEHAVTASSYIATRSFQAKPLHSHCLLLARARSHEGMLRPLTAPTIFSRGGYAFPRGSRKLADEGWKERAKSE